jgi:multidrug efflux system membrane fusion protein
VKTAAAPAAPPANRADAIPVLVATAATRDVPIYLDALGTVQASALVTVRPQVDGTLLEVRFHEGQDVQAGDVLAKIDPRAYQAALDQVVAKKQQDQASLANARLDYGRYRKLAANEYASAQQADTARASVAQLEAQVEQDQAQIDNAKLQLSFTTITAPIDGRLGIRQVDAGNLVHAADATGLVTITKLKPITVIFTLPQQVLRQVNRAMRAGSPEVLALGPDAGNTADQSNGDASTAAAAVIDTGTLTVVDNQVDPSTGTVKLKATFPNEESQLWPGGFVNVRLRVDIRHHAVVVPPAAVLRGPRGAYVFVVDTDGRAHRRLVKVGHEDADGSIIETGLQAGERVVTDGASRLTDTTPVSIANPPESQAPTDQQAQSDQPAQSGGPTAPGADPAQRSEATDPAATPGKS